MRPGQAACAVGFGNSAQFWLNLQSRYDLATTEAEIGERIKAEVLEAG